MERITLPGTSLSVSRICLGGNRLGGDLDEAGSFALLDAWVEMDGNFIDSAHIYADWIPGNVKSSSEKMLGRWLRSRKPQGLVIATKGGHPGLAADATPRLDAVSLRQDLTEALENMGVSNIDLFYVHRDDPALPAADIVGALEGFRREGLIRHYACSNWTTARMEEADAAASATGAQGFVANQPEWSLARRTPASTAPDAVVMDAGMMAYHQRRGMAAIPYSAQAKGFFERTPDQMPAALAQAYDSPRNRQMSDKLRAIAARHGTKPTEIALAALLQAPFVVVPIVGPRDVAQLKSSVTCLDIRLDERELATLFAAD